MEFVWTRLKRWGVPLLRQCLAATPVLLAIAVGLLLAGIWWLGPHWTWRQATPLADLPTRILATLLVLLVPLLMWAGSLRRRYGRLQAEREQLAAHAADPCLPYLHAQQCLLERNRVSFLRHLRGRHRLYQLPWYLLLGEAGAGKTSLIAGSGQNFALTEMTRSVREDKTDPPAYPIEWWISDAAVLIDAPGQFVADAPLDTPSTDAPSMQSIDKRQVPLPPGLNQRLWTHLLHWLSEKRSRRALNGVVLVVDLMQLLNGPATYRQALAQRLRTRLYELTAELGTRLPLYVVLTKLDLLAGFEELFAGLPASSREAVTGFGFSLNGVADFDAWLDEFGQQLDRFVALLGEHTLDAMASARDQAARQRLVSLQGNLAGMRPWLKGFFEQALGSDRFTTPVLVRGIYFASVMQKGLVHNPFVEIVATSHGFLPQPGDAKPRGSDRVYFAQRLFQRAIYPEAGLAGDNLKVARSKRRRLLGGSAVAALSVLLATAGWQHYFTVNRDKASMVLARSQDFSAGAIDTREDSTGHNLLAPLEQIRHALSVYGDYREAWPGVADFGLYQGRAIGPMVDQAYLSLLSRRFLPAIASGVIARMDAAPPGSDEQLAALRVYRMLEDRDNREPQRVMEWMARQWQMAYPGQGQVQAGLMRHLEYALKYADADLPQHRERVAEVQRQLRQLPLPQRVYRSVKQSAHERLPQNLDLRQEVGPAFDVIYNRSALPHSADAQAFAVPAFLTRQGYLNDFEPRIGDLATLAMIDQWVLGERGAIDYSEVDREVLAGRLRALYSADYVDSWRRTLNQLEVTEFSDLGHAVKVLEEVTGPAAPLRRLLETVSANGDLPLPVAMPAMPAVLSAAMPPAAADPARHPQSAPVRREFAALAKLLEEKPDQPAYYHEVLAAIGGLYDYGKAIQDSPDRGKAALGAVLARFSLASPDPISHLRRLADSLPEPLDVHVRQLAEHTAQVLMVEALRELEIRWDADVYRFYQQRLAGRYPFSAAGNDASLEDFEAFFGPGGRLQAFQDRYLNVFVRDNLDALRTRDKSGYLVRTDVLEQLRAAERIRETFFNNQGGLGVQFSLEPLGLSGNKRSSVLALDGQLIPYSHGPSSRVGLIWPNTLSAGPGSRVALVHARGDTSSLGYQGPWSLFRLLSSGQLYGRTDTSVDLSFRIGDGIMRYRINAEKSLNPFTRRPFSGFTLPRTLLASP